MKFFFLLLITATPILTMSQQYQGWQQALQLRLGLSNHGTGDLPGISAGVDYNFVRHRNWIWSASLGSTINDGNIPQSYTHSNGNTQDLSIRYTTAGIQLGANIGYDLLTKSKHDLGIQIGGMFRYQSSSYFDEVNILYPPLTGFPNPVYFNIHESPQKTYGAGGIIRLFVNFSISNSVFVGTTGGVQTDTNGDTISDISFMVGMRIR